MTMMTKAKASTSRNDFLHTLKNLLEKKPYDRVSVKEVCERAGHSRQLFYYYFDSLEDASMILLQKEVPLFQEAPEDWSQIIDSSLKSFGEGRQMLYSMYHSSFRESFVEYLEEYGESACCLRMEKARKKKMRREDREFLEHAFAVLICDALLLYLNGREDASACRARLERLGSFLDSVLKKNTYGS